MVGDEVRQGVDTAVGSAGGVVVYGAEVDAGGLLLVAGDVHGVLHQLVNALVLGGGDGNHGNAELVFEGVYIDAALARSSSIIFRAMTMGMSSSSNCIVR